MTIISRSGFSKRRRTIFSYDDHNSINCVSFAFHDRTVWLPLKQRCAGETGSGAAEGSSRDRSQRPFRWRHGPVGAPDHDAVSALLPGGSRWPAERRRHGTGRCRRVRRRERYSAAHSAACGRVRTSWTTAPSRRHRHWRPGPGAEPCQASPRHPSPRPGSPQPAPARSRC